MSVLINMEMPTSCAFCRFAGAYCYAKGDEDAHSTLPCPLVPVPKHGRLIDADALLDDLLFPSKQFEQGMRELIGDAPTVIPAEPPKEESPAGPYDLLYEEGGPDTR